MQELFNYSTGGTIHIVANNQIGFTTDPIKSRSSLYCTDIGKSIGAPIFHVNGDSIEDVARVCQIAAEYRQKFKQDVIIDIIGYRRYGHNELDQPSFTQPLMYKKIAKHPYVKDIYEKQLISEGVLTEQSKTQLEQDIKNTLEKAYVDSKSLKFKQEEWKSDQWEEIKKPEKYGQVKDTGIDIKILRDIGLKISTLPETFEFHPMIKKIYEHRVKTIQEGHGIDFGTAEALAFATLLTEGNHVRISGQDVERGTFSHRHSILHH